MLVDWILPRAGMMLSFLILSGVMWTSLWLYDEYAANKEAGELAMEIADQIAMVGGMNPGYASAGLSRSVSLPSEVHGANYVLTVDGSLFQVRVEVLGGSRRAQGVAFFPASVVYSRGERVLELRGFDVIDDDEMVGLVMVHDGGELRIRRASFPRQTLVIEARGVGDELLT